MGCETFSADDGTSPYRSLSLYDPLSPTWSLAPVVVWLVLVIFYPSAEALPIWLEIILMARLEHPNLAPFPIHSTVSICQFYATSSPDSLTNAYWCLSIGISARSIHLPFFLFWKCPYCCFSFSLVVLPQIGLNPAGCVDALACLPNFHGSCRRRRRLRLRNGKRRRVGCLPIPTLLLPAHST